MLETIGKYWKVLESTRKVLESKRKYYNVLEKYYNAWHPIWEKQVQSALAEFSANSLMRELLKSSFGKDVP